CVEFWLGMAAAKGVELAMPQTTSLMDACNSQAARFYGYDTLDLDFARDEHGRIAIAKTERASLPTAAEVEAAYDHTKHPNPLMCLG
ncbi:MAG: hypothetical protein NUV51_10885, partial [Sulfuricaulis sp.]|nr:hypothetical protein [Sulfuricaulis sp.]